MADEFEVEDYDSELRQLEDYESKRDKEAKSFQPPADGKIPRSTPEEIFKKMQELRIDLETEIFVVDRNSLKVGGKPSINRTPVHRFTFARNLGLDLMPDYDFIDDDLLTNPSIYAYYNAQLNVAKKMRRRVEREITTLRANLRINIRENWSNPNIPAESLTKDLLESYVDRDIKVILLQSIYDDLDFACDELGAGVRAMRMKHETCRAIASNRQGESYLIGSSRVRSKEERDETPRGKRITEAEIKARKGGDKS